MALLFSFILHTKSSKRTGQIAPSCPSVMEDIQTLPIMANQQRLRQGNSPYLSSFLN